MEINIGQNNGIKSRGGKIPAGATIISPNPKKRSTFIDSAGNQIDPVTKQILKRKEAEDPR